MTLRVPYGQCHPTPASWSAVRPAPLSIRPAPGQPFERPSPPPGLTVWIDPCGWKSVRERIKGLRPRPGRQGGSFEQHAVQSDPSLPPDEQDLSAAVMDRPTAQATFAGSHWTACTTANTSRLGRWHRRQWGPWPDRDSRAGFRSASSNGHSSPQAGNPASLGD